jgi:hypothetical protein
MFEFASREEWNTLATKMTSQEASAISDEALGKAEYYARLSFYLLQRKGAGCCDHNHTEAMTYAEKRTKTVRKALGYSYP